LPFRLTKKFAIKRNELRFLDGAEYARTKGNAVAYVWPDPAISLLRQLRIAGVPIVREMVNCHRATAKTILDAEYKRIGLKIRHSISDESTRFEIEALRYCDIIFCSNKFSEQSLADSGVPEEKIRGVSFGWDPERFAGNSQAIERAAGPTFLFVGYICIRKGAHLLLKYWANSGIRGRLVLVGDIEPGLENFCKEYIDRDDVKVVRFTRDIAPFYRAADVFVFPSIEEGGPQVTYEAAGCGLPLVASPMAAARIADYTTGFVVDPFDEAGWIQSMRTLAVNLELRRQMGHAAQQRALNFTWREVAEARRRILQETAARFVPTLGGLT
jgi:glycosyltransferase involved in cell wall biosynthesis